MYVYLFISLHMCMCVHVTMYVHAYEGLRLTYGDFLNHPLPYFLRIISYSSNTQVRILKKPYLTMKRNSHLGSSDFYRRRVLQVSMLYVRLNCM